MSDQSTMNLNVRVGGALKRHVSNEVSAEGSYENVSEYIRDLIRKDKEKAEHRAFEAVKAELQLAFSAPESEYITIKASDITRGKSTGSK